MENKQTAVDWIFLMLNNPNRDQEFAKKLYDKAKEIEQEQHSKTWERGSYSLLDHGSGEDFEQYFKETYGRD